MLSAEASGYAALSLLSSLPFAGGACVRYTCVGEDASILFCMSWYGRLRRLKSLTKCRAGGGRGGLNQRRERVVLELSDNAASSWALPSDSV